MKDKSSYPMRGHMNSQSKQKADMNNTDLMSGKAGKQDYKKGAHEMSPKCKEGEYSVWDKRS